MYVPGGWEDMERVARLIERLDRNLTDIYITMESRHLLHISHPLWFRDAQGRHPEPFIVMREEHGAIVGGQVDAEGDLYDPTRYATTIPQMLQRTLDYLKTLAKGKRYLHHVWPPHCLIGTPGHEFVAPIMQAVLGWCEREVAIPCFWSTGGNAFVEHFSAVRAEVPAPFAPTPQLNTDLIDSLMDADEILVAGVGKDDGNVRFARRGGLLDDTQRRHGDSSRAARVRRVSLLFPFIVVSSYCLRLDGDLLADRPPAMDHCAPSRTSRRYQSLGQVLSRRITGPSDVSAAGQLEDCRTLVNLVEHRDIALSILIGELVELLPQETAVTTRDRVWPGALCLRLSQLKPGYTTGIHIMPRRLHSRRSSARIEYRRAYADLSIRRLPTFQGVYASKRR